MRRQQRRAMSLGSPTNPAGNVLNSINEEDDKYRKNIIAALGERPATDRLTLYMRLPNDDSSNLGVNDNSRFVLIF